MISGLRQLISLLDILCWNLQTQTLNDTGSGSLQARLSPSNDDHLAPAQSLCTAAQPTSPRHGAAGRRSTRGLSSQLAQLQAGLGPAIPAPTATDGEGSGFISAGAARSHLTTRADGDWSGFSPAEAPTLVLFTQGTFAEPQSALANGDSSGLAPSYSIDTDLPPSPSRLPHRPRGRRSASGLPPPRKRRLNQAQPRRSLTLIRNQQRPVTRPPPALRTDSRN